ncbi:MAG: hypothetical protein AAB971_03355 [Patescibacteria group bacterium]
MSQINSFEAITQGQAQHREQDPVGLARLNDYAEIAIWGSNGRNVFTFGYPNRGDLIVATEQQPLVGILDVLRTTEPYEMHEKPQEERDEAAKARVEKADGYEARILALIEDHDFELIVAKNIVDSEIPDMPQPKFPYWVSLQAELRAKRKVRYLANGGELPFEDADVDENVGSVVYRRGQLDDSTDEHEYSLSAKVMHIPRENLLQVYGPDWPRLQLKMGSVGYDIEDFEGMPEDGFEPGKHSWLHGGRQNPRHAPLYHQPASR